MGHTLIRNGSLHKGGDKRKKERAVKSRPARWKRRRVIKRRPTYRKKKTKSCIGCTSRYRRSSWFTSNWWFNR